MQKILVIRIPFKQLLCGEGLHHPFYGKTGVHQGVYDAGKGSVVDADMIDKPGGLPHALNTVVGNIYMDFFSNRY